MKSIYEGERSREPVPVIFNFHPLSHFEFNAANIQSILVFSKKSGNYIAEMQSELIETHTIYRWERVSFFFTISFFKLKKSSRMGCGD